jgi:hypothetical protein
VSTLTAANCAAASPREKRSRRADKKSRKKQEEERGAIPMTDLVLNVAPLFAVIRPGLEALGLRLTQAIDDFAEARMRNALPARLLRAELERDRGNASPPRPTTAGTPGANAAMRNRL